MERPNFEMDELIFEDSLNDDIEINALTDIFSDDDAKPQRKKKTSERGDKRRRRANEEQNKSHNERADMESKRQKSAEEPVEESIAAPNEDRGDESRRMQESATRMHGRVQKRLSRSAVENIVSRKIDECIDKVMLKEELARSEAKSSPGRISSATMPLHAAVSGPENYCLVDTATSQVIAIKGILRIGRDSSFADLIPAGNATISSQHAQITEKGGILLVRDMDSRNGTFINDERIAKNHNIEIGIGDIVKFSNAEYRVEAL